MTPGPDPARAGPGLAIHEGISPRSPAARSSRACSSALPPSPARCGPCPRPQPSCRRSPPPSASAHVDFTVSSSVFAVASSSLVTSFGSAAGLRLSTRAWMASMAFGTSSLRVLHSTGGRGFRGLLRRDGFFQRLHLRVELRHVGHDDLVFALLEVLLHVRERGLRRPSARSAQLSTLRPSRLGEPRRRPVQSRSARCRDCRNPRSSSPPRAAAVPGKPSSCFSLLRSCLYRC